ncbi:MAG TPA: glutathione S-transferase family protein [Rhizomicrobium sp.]|jgi:glutathione S-transferase
MTLTLHVFPPSPRAFKVLFTANHLGIPYEMKVINLAAGEQRTEEFAALNVNQRMPVLEEDGYKLWESNAIVEYLCARKPESGVLPQELKARLQIVKWMYWESAHWDPAIAIFMFERVVKKMFGRGEEIPSEIERGTVLLDRLAKVLDGELQKHRYIAGDALTAADLVLAGTFCHAEAARFPLEPYRAIHRWAAEMQALPAWAQTIAMQG